MWFKRKPRNRHLRRPRTLNVKSRTRQTRWARLQLAIVALSFSCGTLFLLFGIWRGGEWLLNHFIYKNDAFAIQQIEAQTDGVLAPESLRRWAMIKPNENLLALDLARVKRDLELVPIVQSAAVERILPHTLKLRVVEREAVAQIQIMQLKQDGSSEQVIYHLDDSGFVMLPLDPHFCVKPPEITSDSLPIISGLSAQELRPGRRLDSEQGRAALRLIDAFDRSRMFGLADLQRIDVATPEVLRAFTSQGSEIVFSLDQFEKQLRRWHLVFEQSQKWNKAIGSLDLSMANNIPLRLSDAESA
ncbi:MAG: FtsQ-type POTRA domain-containing protein, partial [Verrucomicrobiota bacterium]|nr:FtsQ-type POTRA domain-containing protein [Verrucomicrobiota bacterium]